MDHFYSGQLRNYRLQIIRAFSNFSVKYGDGSLRRVPCRYGDPSRIAENVVRGGSENKLLSCPFITVYIRDISMNNTRRQDPTLVDTVQVNERNYNTETQRYGNDVGNRYTVQRYMPVPYDLTVQVDIWTNNLDSKEQLAEQILVLYNPSIDIQTSVNPLDWSWLTVLEMQESITWSSRSIPQGTDNPIDVMTLNFRVPIWINPPAKVKRQSLIQEIITNIIDPASPISDMEWTTEEFLARIWTTPGNSGIVVIQEDGLTKIKLANSAGVTTDTDQNPTVVWSWSNPVVDPGSQFTWNSNTYTLTSSTNVAAMVSEIRSQLPDDTYNCLLFNQNQIQFISTNVLDQTFTEITPGVLNGLGLPSTYAGGNLAWWRFFKPFGDFRSYDQWATQGSKLKIRLTDNPDKTQPAIEGYMDFDPQDQNKIIWRIDQTTLPGTQIDNINAVVNPQLSGPNAGLPPAQTGQRYLLTDDMPETNIAWQGNLAAVTNSIVEYDGSNWFVDFDPAANSTNNFWVYSQMTGRYLEWKNETWGNLAWGLYRPGQWYLSI